MSFWKPASLKDFFIHVGILLASTALIITFVFWIYLPVKTNHGETITVPDIIGMNPDDLEDVLIKRNLRYEVTPDSSYSPKYPALAVLRQVPSPNAKVKENRKIYVTLNSERPPTVRMPKMEDLSLKSAQMVLKSYDLKLGKIRFVPDVFFGVVLEAKTNGRDLLEGESVEKGTVIDLIVGDGYGNTVFQSPNLIGLEQEEAEVVIVGSGLKVGKVKSTITSKAEYVVQDIDGNYVIEFRDIPPGTVQQQYPKAQKILKIGDPIDIWIYRPDSLSESSTILDN